MEERPEAVDVPAGIPVTQPPKTPAPQVAEVKEEPKPEKRKGKHRLVFSAVVIILLAGAAYYFSQNLSEPSFSGPSGAFVLGGADLPRGWVLQKKDNTMVGSDIVGFIDGSETLSKKIEGDGGVASTVFSRSWKFDNATNAQTFFGYLINDTRTGNFTEFDVDIEGCTGTKVPFPIGGDRAYVGCRTGNLVWEVESRSMIGAAYLYAPLFAKVVEKKIAAGE